MAAAANPPPPDSHVCFAELIVRLDSLLTLRIEDDEQQDEVAHNELEADIKLKLNELHLRLKNGGAVQDRSNAELEEEDSAGEDNMGPSSANETGIFCNVEEIPEYFFKQLAKIK